MWVVDSGSLLAAILPLPWVLVFGLALALPVAAISATITTVAGLATGIVRCGTSARKTNA